MTALMIAASILLGLLAVLFYFGGGLLIARDFYLDHTDPEFYFVLLLWPVIIVCGMICFLYTSLRDWVK